MRQLFAALVLVSTLVVVPHAEALPESCLPAPFPVTPTGPTFSGTLTSTLGTASVALWRGQCQDGQTAVLLRATPTSGAPFVCSTNFTIVQNAAQLAAAIRTPGDQSFCASLFVATTFLLVEASATTPFNESGAFTLINNFSSSNIMMITVPAGSFQPPGPPTLLVVATGCTTCHPGNTLGFELHVTNTGAPMLVELKTGARLPDGSVVSILGRHEEELLPGGVTVIPLFTGFVLPAGIPAGPYTIEAAILEPELGVTISRHSLPLALQP